MTFLRILLAFVILYLFSLNGYASQLYFMALIGDDWQLYQTSVNLTDRELVNFRPIQGVGNARDFSVSPDAAHIAWVNAAGDLKLFDTKTKTSRSLAIGGEGDRFTQLSFSGDRLWAVHLPAGKSRQTHLVSLSLSDQKLHRHVSRRGSQFDPYFSQPYLYFSAALCIDDCDPMIWEVWRRDTRSFKMEQMTHGNAVSRSPLETERYLYFISNRAGSYHIWRKSKGFDKAAEQLTHGHVKDSDPVALDDKHLVFIRKVPGKTSLQLFSDEHELTELGMPDNIIDVRGLEYQQL